MYQAERDCAVTENEKEKLAKLELSENIVNTSHNIKSPTTALGRAMDTHTTDKLI